MARGERPGEAIVDEAGGPIWRSADDNPTLAPVQIP